ncbi:MAG: MarR family transcriptional regulator [Planctomycetes bacterium]|nr:MarR family transcriptional regulator [Planctomycetota bacterium]
MTIESGSGLSETYVQRSRVMARLIVASQQVYHAVNELVRRHDLTESQYNALRVLRGAEKRNQELTQADLAARLIASRANTTWILDHLEERKLVRRKGHSDRRKNLVELTAAGHKLLQRIDPEFEQLLEQILGDLKTDELTQLEAVVTRFRFL